VLKDVKKTRQVSWHPVSPQGVKGLRERHHEKKEVLKDVA
jgi:hypothetical protein